MNEDMGLDDKNLENFVDDFKSYINSHKESRDGKLKNTKDFMESMLIQQRLLEKKVDTDCTEYAHDLMELKKWFMKRVRETYGNNND